ncbi:MAG: preprotein translocase subunit SecG [Clostridiales bacterium]|jgi:preprotein translocase subunit SecG|nr:preprotein translocase subunit SecG [Clostridiales bacterium]
MKNILSAALTIPYSVWSVLYPVLMILMVVLSIFMIILVLSQDGNTADLGAISGNTETFLGKNKVKTRESKFKRRTIYVGIALLVTSIAFFIVWTLSE